MESLLNKPVYNFTKNASSQVFAYGRSNCCFISSFQIQMANKFENFPGLKTLLELLYPNQTNAYTQFAQDFPAKWFTIKNYLITQTSKWKEKLDNVLLHICLPLKTPNQCVQLTFLDLNAINVDEVASGKYDSLEASFTDDYNPTKTIISIMQYSNHFEPINVEFSHGTKLTNLDELGISESFFN
jgi:hypothetical protein